MSIASVNAVGAKISTKIRQAMFDSFNVEAYMYMGKEAVSMYSHAMKRSTWSQIGWNFLGGQCGESILDRSFTINAPGSQNLMDYLLALEVEAVFPQITLANTAAPAPFTSLFGLNNAAAPDATTIAENGAPLYFYLSDGSYGLAGGILYVGSLTALQALTDVGAEILPFISYAPRHRVGWGMNALIAAIDQAAFFIDNADYELLSRHAIYNALQFRTREDVYPVMVEEATSFDAVLLPAAVGADAEPVVLGGPANSDRYKAMVLPFSFTTSALADRGENGKHKSAFPIMLACANHIGLRVRTIDDLRNILVLEEEVLANYGALPISFVATPEELAIDPETGVATASPFFTGGAPAGSVVFGVPSAGFSLPGLGASVLTTGVNGSSFVVTTNGVPVTYGPTSPFTVSGFGALYLVQSGEYLPVTRPSFDGISNPFSRPVDYSEWILNGQLSLALEARALGAQVTAYERGMMKSDCRTKEWLYDRYGYFDEVAVPGSFVNIDAELQPGQFKYAYTFGQNGISQLQGQFFNYTNNTEYNRILDEDLARPKFVFSGDDSLVQINTRIQGYLDEDHPSKFYRYVDNGLFAQRLPRENGLHVAPRFANWINAIYPDGSINAQAIGDVTVGVRTAPSGLTSVVESEFFNMANTYFYNVQVIAVSWGLALFELQGHKHHEHKGYREQPHAYAGKAKRAH